MHVAFSNKKTTKTKKSLILTLEETILWESQQYAIYNYHCRPL